MGGWLSAPRPGAAPARPPAPGRRRPAPPVEPRAEASPKRRRRAASAAAAAAPVPDPDPTAAPTAAPAPAPARAPAPAPDAARGRAREPEAPVLAQHRLRVVRGADGELRVDTAGVALYTDAFLAALAGSASVLVAGCGDAGGGAGRPAPPPGHAEQRNFLGGELRAALRRRTVATPRTAAALDALNASAGRCAGRAGAEREARRVDVRGRIVLAPLTTNGNLPFRRLVKALGVDVTVGEMALAEKLLQGHNSEWALLRRHRCEDVFGVQLAGSNEAVVMRAAEVVARECDVDFIDLNAGCPIDLIYNRGAGCALMGRAAKFTRMVAGAAAVVGVPLSVKIRTGVDAGRRNAHALIPRLAAAGAAWVTVHGRTRTQRYSRSADWEYLREQCAPAAAAAGIPLVGNGDVYSWRDADAAGVDAVMLARGALIKPWLATEIKERRDWDIAACERLDLYRDFCRFGLDHWGADARGVATTRKFFLEMLSFTYRYVPVGLLETGDGAAAAAVTMSHRAPPLRGRNELETLFASQRAADWIRISEMFLGPVPASYTFAARHKSNAWNAESANG